MPTSASRLRQSKAKGLKITIKPSMPSASPACLPRPMGSPKNSQAAGITQSGVV